MRTVGEEFDVLPNDIDLLLRLGRIQPNEGEYGFVQSGITAAKPASYSTRDMGARQKGVNKRKAGD